MEIAFNLSQRGAVRVNSAIFLHLSSEAFVLSLDCKQKYPEGDVDWFVRDDEGPVLLIMAWPGESTLHVPDDAPRDGDGEHKITILEVLGLEGEWHLSHHDGKWGPYVYGVRKVQRDEAWPQYDAPEGDDDEEDRQGA